LIKFIVYSISVLLLVVVTFVVFRIFIRRDYQRKGRLTPLSSFLELLIWSLYMSFPYLYNPSEWAWFWSQDVPVGAPLRIIGVICIIVGLVLAFGTMLWFGLRRAFGLEVDKLIQIGPYRFTRNPQLVGGSLLVIGAFVLWPSLYALGWVVLYGFVAHMMVFTEEEHLHDVYGEDYVRYCERVPRYLGLRRRL
jgi:protein-S-isoprenylcysteine O-methyltransferase Ste14